MSMWAVIPGFPGYEASKDGQIRSWIHKNGRRKKPWTLAQQERKAKAMAVCIRRESGAETNAWVARLVLLAHVGEPPTAQHQAAHNDGDYRNNDIRNLRWATPKENTHDKYRHGTIPLGAKVYNALMTDTDIRTILQRHHMGARVIDLAKEYGVGRHVISNIVCRNTYTNVSWSPHPPCKACGGLGWTAGDTHCVNGHEFTGQNVRMRVKNGYTIQVCRTCQRAYDAKHKAKRRAAKLGLGDTP